MCSAMPAYQGVEKRNGNLTTEVNWVVAANAPLPCLCFAKISTCSAAS